MNIKNIDQSNQSIQKYIVFGVDLKETTRGQLRSAELKCGTVGYCQVVTQLFTLHNLAIIRKFQFHNLTTILQKRWFRTYVYLKGCLPLYWLILVRNWDRMSEIAK